VTLVELVITLAVLAIIVTLAVPSFGDAALGARLSSYANNLVVSANLARSEAIKRNMVVQLCVSTTGTTCAGSGSWEQGWIILVRDNGQVLHQQPAVAAGLRIIANGFRTIDFQPTGFGATFAPTPVGAPQLTVCRATPTPGKQERVVSMTLTGRSSVARTTMETCPS
jgi:type IV fimbrial biogenesis protein FimT